MRTSESVLRAISGTAVSASPGLSSERNASGTSRWNTYCRSRASVSAESVVVGWVNAVLTIPAGEPPTAAYRPWNGDPPPGAKCGTITAIATSEHAAPAAAIASPTGRRRLNAYQSPIAATVKPMCSLVRHASAPTTANATSRSSSSSQKPVSSNGVASATGWKSSTTSHSVAG